MSFKTDGKVFLDTGDFPYCFARGPPNWLSNLAPTAPRGSGCVAPFCPMINFIMYTVECDAKTEDIPKQPWPTSLQYNQQVILSIFLFTL